MKVSTKQIKIFVLLAVSSFLLLPAFAGASQYEVPVGKAEFGPGVHEPVTFSLNGQNTLFSLQSFVMSPNDTLKYLIISVQNGSQRGKDKASSAVVNVNGEDIFTQKNFNQNVTPSSLTTTIDVTDPDMQEVVLTTRVNGHKNVRMGVTITAVYEEQEKPYIWCLDTDVPPNGIGGPITGIGTFTTPPVSDPRGIWFPACGDIQ